MSGSDDANQFCADRYGGHLATIHSVQDYEKLAQVAAGWNQPLMIGLKSDGAGNWQVGALPCRGASHCFVLSSLYGGRCARVVRGSAREQGSLL